MAIADTVPSEDQSLASAANTKVWPKSRIVDAIDPETVMKPTTSWNTKNLGLRLGVDVASAATSGALVAPLITIIDR